VSARTVDFALRHGALRESIAAQRKALASHAGPLESALGNVDRALVGVDWLKAHPEVVGVAVAIAVAVSPKRTWRWSKRAFLVWRGWRSVRNSLLAAR
jgi:hypothetical protein